MNNKIALESLAMDLKRVAIGYHRGSLSMANRFYEEAVERKKEIDPSPLKPYIKKVLERIESLPSNSNSQIAEEALMLSTLIQNYTQTWSL